MNDTSNHNLEELLSQVYAPDPLPERIQARATVLSCVKHRDTRRVYVLLNRTTGEKELLKCDSSQRQQILESEYRRLTETGLPCFPKPYDCFTEDGTTYLLREYIEGDTLEQLVERNGVFSEKDALRTLADVTALIGKLHAKNPPLIHRDIKPQNIVCCPDGSLRLIDFETARSYQAGRALDTEFIGTRQTAAPEQFGYEQTSVRTDIYALGTLLCYLVTGEYQMDVRRAGMLAQSLVHIVKKSTAFDPKRRYRSTAALLRDIRWAEAFRLRAAIAVPGALLCTGLAAVLAVMLYGPVAAAFRQEAPAVFQSELFEAAAHQALGRLPEQPVYPSELADVDVLLLCKDRIFTSWSEHNTYHADEWFLFEELSEPASPLPLDDLRYFPNLRMLALDCQGLTDISALSGLPLEKLSLQRNNITDLSPLTNCDTLNTLWLQKTLVEDITPLAGKQNLRDVNFMCTSVADLTPLIGCPLESLVCHHSGVTDYACLKEFPELTTLFLSDGDAALVEYI
ncbi:MAG: protein kinase, partial [Eubacteriales bacterium]|nr:protein kinase [Eubacteriales bacterium]